MSQTRIGSQVPELELMTPGHVACPGCGGSLAMRMVLKELGPKTVISLPASAISYAPYGDSVFVISDLKDPKGNSYRGVRQQFVKVDGSRGDQVAIVSGLNPGEEVVTSGVFKLRNGAAVKINNKVQPENNPAPKPADS